MAYALRLAPTHEWKQMKCLQPVDKRARMEQARGREADRRTDIFAFGCVLYEMLTGKQAFEGSDVSELLAAVIKSEPEWDRLPAAVPPALRLFLRRCLEKDYTVAALYKRQDAVEVLESALVRR